MPILSFVLGALVLLILVWKLHQWLDAKHSAREQKSLPGHGLHAAPLQARLNEIRNDYGPAALLRHRRTPSHDLIVMTVRRALKKLSYFRSAEAKSVEAIERESQGVSDRH